MDNRSVSDARQEAAADPVARAILHGATYIYDLEGFGDRTSWGRFPERGFLTIPRAEMPPDARETLDVCEAQGIGLWVEGMQ